jgi:hypothetical protein
MRVKLNPAPAKLATLRRRLARGLAKIKRPPRAIYVVHQHESHEGSTVLRALTTREAAEQYAEACKEEARRTSGIYFDEFDVEEITLEDS